jgi:hypothetical protein
MKGTTIRLVSLGIKRKYPHAKVEGNKLLTLETTLSPVLFYHLL